MPRNRSTSTRWSRRSAASAARSTAKRSMPKGKPSTTRASRAAPTSSPSLYERESSDDRRATSSEVSKLSTPWPRSLLASIAANQAQHLVLLRQALGAGLARSIRAATAVRARRPRRPPPVGDDARMTAPALRDRPLLLAPPLPGDRASGWSLAIALVAIGQASGSKTSENLTLPGTGSTDGDRTAGRKPARTGLRQQPAGDGSDQGQADRAEVRHRRRGNRRSAWKRCPTSTRRSARSARQGPPSSARTARSATSRSSSASARANSTKRRRRGSSTRRSRRARPACTPPSAATSASSSPSPRPRSARRSASPPR